MNLMFSFFGSDPKIDRNRFRVVDIKSPVEILEFLDKNRDEYKHVYFHDNDGYVADNVEKIENKLGYRSVGIVTSSKNIKYDYGWIGVEKGYEVALDGGWHKLEKNRSLFYRWASEQCAVRVSGGVESASIIIKVSDKSPKSIRLATEFEVLEKNIHKGVSKIELPKGDKITISSDYFVPADQRNLSFMLLAIEYVRDGVVFVIGARSIKTLEFSKHEMYRTEEMRDWRSSFGSQIGSRYASETCKTYNMAMKFDILRGVPFGRALEFLRKNGDEKFVSDILNALCYIAVEEMQLQISDEN